MDLPPSSSENAAAFQHLSTSLLDTLGIEVVPSGLVHPVPESPPSSPSNTISSTSRSDHTGSNLGHFVRNLPFRSPSPPAPRRIRRSFRPRPLISPPAVLPLPEKYRLRRLLRHIKYRFDSIINEIKDDLDIDSEDEGDGGYPGPAHSPRIVGPGPHSIGFYPRRPRTPDRSPSPTVEEERDAALQRVEDRVDAQEVAHSLSISSPAPLHLSSDDETGPSLPSSLSRLPVSLVDRLSSPAPSNDIADLFSDRTPPEFQTGENEQEHVDWTYENVFAPGNDEVLLHHHGRMQIYHTALQANPEENLRMYLHLANERLAEIGHGHVTLHYDFNRYRPVAGRRRL